MAEPMYFIRWKGVHSGPFSADQVRQALKSGKINRHCQFSEDRQAWQPISGADVFSADESQPVSVSVVGEPELARNKLRLQRESALPDDGDSDDHGADDECSDGTLWFYSCGGEVAGPIGLDKIGMMIDRKKLPVTTQICAQGGKKWQPASVALGMAVAPVVQQPQYIPNHMAFAIISMIFGFMPFGIVAIVYAAQVNGLNKSGEVQRALDVSSKANSWAWWSFGINVIGWLLLMALGIYAS